ncbi:MAG: hypothetical protein R2786_03745 [Flavobacteriaceae bacterium]
MGKNTLASTKVQGKKAKKLLDFINETKKGTFSIESSIIENISFSRIEVEQQIQETQEIPENIDLTNVLFGISN